MKRGYRPCKWPLLPFASHEASLQPVPLVLALHCAERSFRNVFVPFCSEAELYVDRVSERNGIYVQKIQDSSVLSKVYLLNVSSKFESDNLIFLITTKTIGSRSIRRGNIVLSLL